MSDPYTGARAPDESQPYGEVPITPAYPATTVPAEPVYATTYPAPTTTTTGGDSTGGGVKDQAKEKAAEVKDQAKEVAGQSKQAAGQAAGEVKDTVKEQAHRVGSEAKTQARSVASDVRDRVTGEARSQTDRLSGTVRDIAGQLDEMRGDRAEGPAAAVVSRVADGGRQLADYLDRNGPEGVLREVGDFARRRPGAFLATALAAGFVVGRLGKGVMKADEVSHPDAKPATDQFSSYEQPSYDQVTPATGYPATTTTGYTTTGTEYAATGTGTPAVVEEDYVVVEERPGGLR
ncbi:hypothetical protein [Symbioplanes lichenis]|uniref:hypothetical protein n=1 Tax=Symbioplanes lichenis TaxID=1629072 RepID=UPI0027399EBD|nr:hypothetical protein [Actinoplanes lichenis]